MKVMTGHPSLWPHAAGPTAVTVGVLDGVHLGHRSLIRRLDPALARMVLTFEPHPVEVLRPGTHPRLLTTLEERIELFDGAGVDQVGVLDLNDIKEYEPRRFVTEVLVDRLSAKQVVCGGDFRFGRDRAGDPHLLAEMGKGHGFIVDEAPMIVDDGGSVLSSSAIRLLVETGRIAEANRALGSTFQITGEVVKGDQRGTEMGVPTVNLELPERKVVPLFGVYAGFARWDGRRHNAAINVGVRPTFGGGRPLVEAHILDFEGDLYGKALTVEFARYLRPELRFDTTEELMTQMERDIDETRSLLP
jgi:riboflavin kinase / FMN adenylyltransferase